MAKLEGKTALVTGGAKHLGKAIALAMARARARVAFTYLHSEKEASRTLEEVKKTGAEAMAVRCDVRDGKSISEAVRSVLDRWPQLDLLVNNAGFYEDVLFPDITEEQWDNMFDTNVRGAFLISKQCIPTLKATSGKIINIGSLGGEKAWSTHAHYCASKAALHMLTRVMAKSLAPEIAVNCVAPGMLYYGEGDPVQAKKFADKTPMRRNGTAEDVVSSIMYLATAPHFITGQIVLVDGGLGLQ